MTPRPQAPGTPHRGLDVTVLLGVAVLALMLRIPGAVVLLVLTGPFIVLVRGLRVHSGLHAPLLWLLYGTGIACSVVAQAPTPSKLLGINSATIMAAQLVVAVACLRTGAPRTALRWITSGLYWGLVGLYLLGAFEVVSGHKMLPLLYPDASAVDLVQSNRVLATAIFPNYNDFSVALVFLAALCVTRLVFGRGRAQAALLADGWLLVTSLAWVLVMGSRGALMAGLLTVAVALLASVMAVHPGRIRPPHVIGGALAALVAVGLLWTTPWLQDNSTKVRVQILQQAGQMMADDPFRLLFGWGSYGQYKAAAAEAYGSQLMDTHNVLLEMVVSYGLPTMLVFVACWLWIIVRGLLQQQIDRDWRSMGLVVLVASLPLLGVVPSSLLRYHWPFLVTTACATALAVARRGALAARAPAPTPATGPAGATGQDGTPSTQEHP